jgi:hypothetical protein
MLRIHIIREHCNERAGGNHNLTTGEIPAQLPAKSRKREKIE